MVLRKSYLDKIIPFIDQDLIKILVGIRRCGKTVFTGITTISQEPCQDLEMTVRSTARSLQKCLQPVCIL